ncbi:hypothetical protein HY945_03605 [Candidatus Gottesmanbacteria bacterium]|nr:hypothetical protein [Candidatus Gottesmanbacteria bacterium]
MTIRHQIEFGTISFLSLAAVAGITFAVLSNNKPQIPTSFALPVVESIQEPTPTATPAPKTDITEQPAPDGRKKLRMTTVVGSDTEKTFTFTVIDTATNEEKIAYKTITSNDENLSIPFNTWSPDDKYFFIKQVTNSGTDSLVFRGDGAPITETEQFLNSTSIFKAQITNNKYQDTTGWASETLLIINTTTPSDTIQSYWFEVPSKAIIPLATQFYD